MQPAEDGASETQTFSLYLCRFSKIDSFANDKREDGRRWWNLDPGPAPHKTTFVKKSDYEEENEQLPS